MINNMVLILNTITNNNNISYFNTKNKSDKIILFEQTRIILSYFCDYNLNIFSLLHS